MGRNLTKAPAWGFAIGLMLLSGLTGCVGKVSSGSIYALDDGAMSPIEVRKDIIDGTIRFTDLKSGEFFSGTYGKVSGRSKNDPALAAIAENPHLQSASVDAVATLAGNRGSTLHCTLSLQEGQSHHGMGNCADRNGRTFRLQF